MKVTKEYEWNEIKWAELNVGDTVQLPEFTVSETTIKGNKELYFEEHKIKDTATVYNIKNGKVYLVFDHALFTSAMDLNKATEWKKTQLHEYLQGDFKNSMKNAGIPVSKVSLLSKDKILGEEALPFFKDGRNRIAFEKDELYNVWYWLKCVASAANFCFADSRGNAVNHALASNASVFIRPCLTVKKDE